MSAASATAQAAAPNAPLVVDLDGTLIRSDLLHDGLIAACKADPRFAARLPALLRRGKAAVKAEVARRAPVDPATLPYNAEVLRLIRAAASSGREVVLATASPLPWAQSIADHLGLFSGVIATGAEENLAGAAKLRAVQTLLGGRPFDYVGNGAADLPLWAAARTAIVVNAAPAIARRAQGQGGSPTVIDPRTGRARDLLRALRPHQWVKNLLIFVPLAASHQIGNPALLAQAALAFAAFSLLASATYILNDLSDLPADRAHPRKRNRPFASGRLSVGQGIATAAVCLLIAAVLAALAPPAFAAVLALYFVATLLYSFKFKRVSTLDIFTLAGLYTIRVIAGGAATGIAPSFFLLGFSMFLFFALASVKRVSELVAAAARGVTELAGRGYRAVDLDTLTSLGTASSYAAVVVLAMYIQSGTGALYTRPTALWGLCAILMYWISRVWIGARRGLVHDDPIVFALKDPVSRVLALMAAGVIFAAGPAR